MGNFELKPASGFSNKELADLLTRSFEEYFVPITITESALLTMIRRDSVDLNESRVILKDGKPVGAALIARRGWTSRLAAMGIIKAERNHGAGKFAMQKLIEEARARGDKEMTLEVIEQNTAGVKLYKNCGFEVVRKLFGYKLEKPSLTQTKDEFEEVDIREASKAITSQGLKDLPWQLSGESIAHHTPPSRAFKLDDVYILISNPALDDITIWSVLAMPHMRGAGLVQQTLRALMAKFPNKTWHVPAIYPEEMGNAFEQIGMKREELSQLQMIISI